MGMLKVQPLANATSLAATTSYPFTADSHKVVAAQVVYTSTTASFSVSLQYSQDNVTWKDYTTATTVTNASGDIDYQVVDKDALYWQVKATRTSGTLTTFKVYLVHIQR